MSNVLPDRIINDIKRLAARGEGLRAIARALGVAKNTVAKYYQKPIEVKCGCGGEVGHKGWCKYRYAQSTARQAFHASRSGKSISVLPAIKFSRMSNVRRRQARWLGLDPSHKADPVPYAEMYGIIGEARHATKYLPPECREDVCHEVIVAACEGRIRRDEIRDAVRFFNSIEWRRNNNPGFVHLDDAVDGRGYDRFLIENPWGGTHKRARPAKGGQR